MTKRAPKFERRPRDFYATPESAVVSLLPHLEPRTLFAEPCCGEMDLVNHLSNAGHICTHASDVLRGDDARYFEARDAHLIITNPPWSRDILHELIAHFSDQRPTWLLLDADWKHTKQAIPFGARCKKIVSVGRVSWMGNNVSGFDNCAWYLFDRESAPFSQFYWRAAE